MLFMTNIFPLDSFDKNIILLFNILEGSSEFS